MADRPTTAGLWIVASLAVLTWLSPVTGACFSVSVGAGWTLGRSGTAGRIAAGVIHLALMVVSRAMGDGPLAALGLAALGLQQLVWLTRDADDDVSLVDYVMTTVFLPRALAGPVWQSFHRHRAKPDPAGFELVVLGLFEKIVVADSFARLADSVFDGHGPVGFIAAWSGIVAFAAQALFGLAGLWHVALGLSRLVGYPLPTGPDRPFHAPDLGQLWARWHPSLWAVLQDRVVRPLSARPGLAALAASAVAIGFHAAHPMLALAAASQVLWLGLARLTGLGRVALIGTTHAFLLARSPTLERAAFLHDGLLGLFGLGPVTPPMLLALAGGVMVLSLGPIPDARVFGTRSPDPRWAVPVLGLAIAAIVLFASGARPALYPTF